MDLLPFFLLCVSAYHTYLHVLSNKSICFFRSEIFPYAASCWKHEILITPYGFAVWGEVRRCVAACRRHATILNRRITYYVRNYLFSFTSHPCRFAKPTICIILSFFHCVVTANFKPFLSEIILDDSVKYLRLLLYLGGILSNL